MQDQSSKCWVIKVDDETFNLSDKQMSVLAAGEAKGVRLVVFEDCAINTSYIKYAFKHKNKGLPKPILKELPAAKRKENLEKLAKLKEAMFKK
jgi:hypothetical protein